MLPAGCQTTPSSSGRDAGTTRIQPHLGTFVAITVHHPDTDAAHRAINAAFEEIRAVDKLLSIHRPDSELARLNQLAPKQPVQASPELFAILTRVLTLARESKGAFDPTIRPLADLWGFIRKEGYRLPTPAERRAILPNIGWDKVTLDPPRRLVRFANSGLSIDPGGFGKGYAVDRAIHRLQQLGIENAKVEAGGDLRVMGLPPGRGHWTIRLEDPQKKGNRISIPLRSGAISTSGNYENFFMSGGKRYSHLLDPRTGLPVQGIASCTVVAPTCLETDALATACFILGPESGLRLFKNRIGILWFTEERGKLSTMKSLNFPE